MANKEIVIEMDLSEMDVVRITEKWASIYAHILNAFHGSLDSEMDLTLKRDLTCIYFTQVLLAIGDGEVDPDNRND